MVTGRTTFSICRQSHATRQTSPPQTQHIGNLYEPGCERPTTTAQGFQSLEEAQRTSEDAPVKVKENTTKQGATTHIQRNSNQGSREDEENLARGYEPLTAAGRQHAPFDTRPPERVRVGSDVTGPQNGRTHRSRTLCNSDATCVEASENIRQYLENVRKTLQARAHPRIEAVVTSEEDPLSLIEARGDPRNVQGRHAPQRHSKVDVTHNRRFPSNLHRRQVASKTIFAKLFSTEYDYVNAAIDVTVREDHQRENRQRRRYVERVRQKLEQDWPIYTPHMPKLELSWATGISELETALAWLQNRDLYVNLLRHRKKSRRRQFNNIAMEPHIQQFVDADIIEIADERKISAWYRLIVETRDLNDLWKRLGFPYTDLPQMDHIRELTLTSDIISCADLKCYYYQLPLDEAVRNFFGIKIGKRVFRLTRLPMGATISVYVAHTISSYMHRQLLPRNTPCMTYIDNWYSKGNNVNHYDKCIAKLSENTAGTKMTILGVDVDTTEKTIRLGSKYARHVPFLRAAMDRELTHTEMWKVLGVVMRFVLVAARPLHDKYFLLCMIRRASRNLAMDETGELWNKPLHCSPAEKHQLKQLVQEACEMKTYKIVTTTMSKDPTVLFTDASAKAWGVVRLEQSTMKITSGKLPEMPIHEGEAQAVVEGLEDCRHSQAVAIIVDNTIVAQAIVKGHSTNKVVNHLCEIIATWPVRISIAWVPSEENWADGPSRSKQVRLAEIESLQFQPAKQWLSVCVAASPTNNNE
ncbi:unnamed protein product [Bodo saltans]|uniref:Uncharacterized protein n=1 Tax=Bodo saltans TaxID=75058 RepID=A0A0S4IQY6_BODSA|nr:unnamed protein product [Bodo saltans]|eukprot:CUF22587.1 unnamed protein product [Bodo saltans]